MYSQNQILTREEILATLREIKPRLSSEYAVEEIGLFGSFSSGYADENSDIDLIVKLREPIGWKFLTLARGYAKWPDEPQGSDGHFV